MLDALAGGAKVHGPGDACPSKELRNAYEVRRKHLKTAGIRMPGFDLVADLFVSHPDGAWRFIGIDGQHRGGVLVMSADDEEPVACFAYSDASK